MCCWSDLGAISHSQLCAFTLLGFLGSWTITRLITAWINKYNIYIYYCITIMKPWRIYTRSIDLKSRNDGYDRQKTLRRRWFEVLGLLHLGGGKCREHLLIKLWGMWNYLPALCHCPDLLMLLMNWSLVDALLTELSSVICQILVLYIYSKAYAWLPYQIAYHHLHDWSHRFCLVSSLLGIPPIVSTQFSTEQFCPISSHSVSCEMVGLLPAFFVAQISAQLGL